MKTVQDIIPITKARSKLGNIAEKVSGEDYVILTKGGVAKAAIVDVNYLSKLQKDVNQLYQKTFIDPKLVKYTRIFSDKEIEKWQKEDKA
jgi:Ca2+-dependent lipid-binding protein